MATDIKAQKNVTVTEGWRKKVVIDRLERKRRDIARVRKNRD